ncbi:unnamed protein product, partial [Rangifer tarandus platyrhynchus]
RDKGLGDASLAVPAHSWWELPDWPSPSTCLRVGLVANLLKLIFFFFFFCK